MKRKQNTILMLTDDSPPVSSNQPINQPSLASKVNSGAEATLVPKPTKKEIIEALVLRKKTQLMADYNAWEQQCIDLRKEILLATQKELKKVDASGWVTDRNVVLGHGACDTIDFHVSFTPSTKIQELMKELSKIARRPPRQPYDPDIRHEITQAMNCDPARVKALSESPVIAETLAYIDEHKNVLKSIEAGRGSCWAVVDEG